MGAERSHTQTETRRPSYTCARIERFLLLVVEDLQSISNKRDNVIVRSFFGIKRTRMKQNEIGPLLQISSERARQIINEAMEQCKKHMLQRREGFISQEPLQKTLLYPHRHDLPKMMPTLRDKFTSDEGFLAFLERYTNLQRYLVAAHRKQIKEKAQLKHLCWIELFPRLTTLDLERAFEGSLPQGKRILVEINGIISKVHLSQYAGKRLFKCPACDRRTSVLLVQGDSFLACEHDLKEKGFQSLAKHHNLKLHYRPIQKRKTPKIKWKREEKEYTTTLREQGMSWIYISKVLKERFKKNVTPNDIVQLCESNSFIRAGTLKVGEVTTFPLGVWIEFNGRTGVVWISVPKIKAQGNMPSLTIGRVKNSHLYNPLNERRKELRINSVKLLK